MSDVAYTETRPAGAARLSSVPYLPGLDGMRAFAVVSVMVYHANSEWLKGGFLGVEVFFVISGYLITLLLMDETERTGRVDLVGFWVRRARRLLPALFTMMFGVLVYTAFFNTDRLGELRGDLFAGLAYVSNWYQIWVGQGYSDSGDFAVLRHLWSLAVEEQFYLVWPLVMALLLRRGTRRLANTALWLFGIAVAITIFTAVVNYTGEIRTCEVTPDAYWTIGERCISKPDTLYLSTVTRAGGLMLGAGFAMIWRPVAIMRGPLRNAGRMLDLVAVVAIAILAFLHVKVGYLTATGVDPWLFRGGFFLTGIATLAVIAAVTHRYALVSRVLGNPVLVWIGTRSYGLYLYHWVIYQMIRKVAGRPLTLNEFAVAMIATFIVSELSYRLIETPVRKRQVANWWASLKNRRDPVPRQIALGVGTACVALLAVSSIRLGTAEVLANENEASFAEGEGSTVSLDEMLGGGDAATTAPPTATTAVPAQADTGSSTTSSTTTTTTTTTTTLPSEPVNYLAVGDSVMLGAAPQLAERGWTVDAAVSRQMADVVPLFEKLADNELIGDPVFVHLGTNGPISEETVDALLDTLSGTSNVIMFNVRADRSWTAENNAILAARDRPGDNIILYDWNTKSQECQGDCFADDGIHLSADGRRFYAETVTCIVLACE